MKRVRSLKCEVGEVGGKVSEFKRRLSSPVLPNSKHVCLDRRTPESLVSTSTDGQMLEPKISKTEDSAAEKVDVSEKPEVKLLSVGELLQLDDTQLISHLTIFSHDGCDGEQFSGVSYQDLDTLFNRAQNSPAALQNFVSSVVVPFLGGKKVCTRNDSAIISECIDCDSVNYVTFVMNILKTCRKQIIDGTAKIVILKPTKIDDVLSGLTDLKQWSEEITAFLILVVKDTCNVSAIEIVMQYLVTHSDEKSSKSCTLVMRILISYAKHEVIVKLCSQFAERSKCFLKKALLQKLEDVFDGVL